MFSTSPAAQHERQYSVGTKLVPVQYQHMACASLDDCNSRREPVLLHSSTIKATVPAGCQHRRWSVPVQRLLRQRTSAILGLRGSRALLELRELRGLPWSPNLPRQPGRPGQRRQPTRSPLPLSAHRRACCRSPCRRRCRSSLTCSEASGISRRQGWCMRTCRPRTSCSWTIGP